MNKELTLTINSAEKRIQLILSRGDDMLCAQDWLAPQAGAELLAPALEDACRRLGAVPADITRAAAVAGPGSFTGIRLALTTVSGLVRSGRVRTAGLDYLQALAASIPARPGERIRVLVSARRGWVYRGDYIADPDGLPRPGKSMMLLPVPEGEEAAASWILHDERPGPDYLIGSGLAVHRACLPPLLPAGTRLLPPACDHPTPSGLLRLTRNAEWGEGDIAPRYLRDCDAVDNLDAIALARGQDPARARERLKRLLTADLPGGPS